MADVSIKNIADYFIRSANQFPDRNALVVNEHVITYQELFRRVSKLAGYLSLRKEQYCALLGVRGVDSYVALLAILMAGKTYIPISTKSPLERNSQILKFSDTQILIVERECLNQADKLLKNSHDPLHVILLGSDPTTSEPNLLQNEFVSDEIIANNECLMYSRMSNDAYLLFTSGSTGAPKAVMTSHVSAIEYIEKLSQRYQLSERDRFSQLTDFTFDVAIHELFLCWANGGCLYNITDHQLASVHRFIHQHQLTIWTSVPSVLSLLKQGNRLKPDMFPSIRHSIFLGEPLAEELVKRWHLAAPNSQIDNLYGPTEATIIFTAFRWYPGHSHPSGYVPIGIPLQGQEIAILNENRLPVAKGEIGELYICGSQVAKGYWKNIKLTEDKFVILDPKQPNKYWYKTGDLVYWEENVGLVYKGRDNDLIKVRGGRIERLEVEMVLSKIAETNLVAVVPLPASEDGVVLGIVAYVGKSSVDDISLQKNCRLSLPEYMIPTKFVRVDALPCNKNGKVDYQLLKQSACKNLGITI